MGAENAEAVLTLALFVYPIKAMTHIVGIKKRSRQSPLFPRSLVVAVVANQESKPRSVGHAVDDTASRMGGREVSRNTAVAEEVCREAERSRTVDYKIDEAVIVTFSQAAIAEPPFLCESHLLTLGEDGHSADVAQS